MSSANNGDTTLNKTPANELKSTKRRIYPFFEARRIARGHGFSSKDEFFEYECAGAYQLPKNPEIIWKNKGWTNWDDFLGIKISSYCDARAVLQKHNMSEKIQSEEEYLAFMKGLSNYDEESGIPEDSMLHRLPYRPDLFYKKDWSGWDDWLGSG